MLVIFPLLFFGINKAFTYYDGPSTRAEAKAYCESQGTTLATITQDSDRLQALIAMVGKPDAPEETHPWIGLQKVGGAWGYPEDPDAVCPSTVDCVGHYWYGEQALPGDAKACAFFCPLLYNGNGGVINGECEERRPFLCSEPSVDERLCDLEDYDACTSRYTLCNPNGGTGVGLEGWLCICDHNSFGVSHCRSGVYCSGHQTNCPNGDSDCPTGEICITDSCCSQPVCSPLCDETIEPNRRRLIPFVLDERRPPCMSEYRGKGCRD